MPSKFLTSLQSNGFVIVPNLLSESEVLRLREAATKATAFARSGAWPHVRTLPKQFPPWPTPIPGSDSNPPIWGVQHLMHPSLPGHETFTATYFSPATMNVAKALLECEDDELVMELFNMLIRPEQDFELRWHRDDIPATASPEEELEKLGVTENGQGRGVKQMHAQWNLSLWDDQSLVVVPGSHLRARTEAEKTAGLFDKLDGEIKVPLKAGDAVFYNNNILHRGVYDAKVERMTLHGSVGCVSGDEKRARNVLQHGVRDWIQDCDFSYLESGERELSEGMRKRLVALGERAGDVGYSLQG